MGYFSVSLNLWSENEVGCISEKSAELLEELLALIFKRGKTEMLQ